MGSIVIDAEEIVERSLIAAGALVAPGTVIPPRSLVIGAPARVKRQLTDEEVAGLDTYWRNYIEYTKRYKSDE